MVIAKFFQAKELAIGILWPLFIFNDLRDVLGGKIVITNGLWIKSSF
jgi:hypothetical protein